jgi:hypothetical protein
MVFSFSIKGRMPTLPPNKRYEEAFRTEEVWGTLNWAGVTTGDVDLECDNVLHIAVTIAEGARVPQVSYDTPSAGIVRLAGVTSNDTGRFRALVGHRKH